MYRISYLEPFTRENLDGFKFHDAVPPEHTIQFGRGPMKPLNLVFTDYCYDLLEEVICQTKEEWDSLVAILCPLGDDPQKCLEIVRKHKLSKGYPLGVSAETRAIHPLTQSGLMHDETHLPEKSV